MFQKLKFIYSEKATKFCEIFPVLLTVCTVVKSKGKISQNFVAFSEYMNFNFWRSSPIIESGIDVGPGIKWSIQSTYVMCINTKDKGYISILLYTFLFHFIITWNIPWKKNPNFDKPSSFDTAVDPGLLNSTVVPRSYATPS